MYICIRWYFGLVVQLVRIHACHAWGRGFESRPDPLIFEDNDSDGISDHFDRDDDNDGISDNIECGFANAGLVNGDFEMNAVAANSFRLISQVSVPGWLTTDSKNEIEIWGDGFLGRNSFSGSNFAFYKIHVIWFFYRFEFILPILTFGGFLFFLF